MPNMWFKEVQTYAKNVSKGIEAEGTIPEGYVKPEGTKTITENGENIDVAEYAKVTVAVATQAAVNPQA